MSHLKSTDILQTSDFQSLTPPPSLQVHRSNCRYNLSSPFYSQLDMTVGADKAPQEPSRKRRRVSVDRDRDPGLDPEEADNCSYPFAPQKACLANFMAVKRPRLDDVYLSENCPPISKDEHYKAWLMNVGCTRRSKNTMYPLPSPDGTSQCFSRSPPVTSKKSTASVHDSDYREKLENYKIYVPGRTPPSKIMEEAEKMVFRRRETPELEDAVIYELKETLKDLQNEGEEDIRSRLSAHIIPGYSTPSDKRLNVVHNQLWYRAVPIPLKLSLLVRPLPLPKPKPDTTFAFSKTAFTESQLETIKSLIQGPDGPNFVSPSANIRFPFAVIEYKSQATNGSIHVATNQVAGAGAVALNGLLKLMNHGSGLDAFDVKKPLFFSVTMDQTVAHINMHWIGKTSDTNEYTFHLRKLRVLPLQYDDSIRVLQRALKNIQDYAAGDLLKIIVDALDEYRSNKMKEGDKDSMEKRPKPRSKKPRRAAPTAPKKLTRPRVPRQQDAQTAVEA